MDRDERRRKVLALRECDIEGRFVILRPASCAYSREIVELRNRPANRYWMNQESEISIESQNIWFESYLQKSNDIYWVVLDKEGRFIGTIRVYEIDLDGLTCSEGSYIIDEAVTDEAPYAIEAKLLALDVAFNVLQIQTMINDNRADNKSMNNIDNQLGFSQGYIHEIREIEYRHRVLSMKDFAQNRQKFELIIDYWSKR